MNLGPRTGFFQRDFRGFFIYFIPVFFIGIYNRSKLGLKKCCFTNKCYFTSNLAPPLSPDYQNIWRKILANPLILVCLGVKAIENFYAQLWLLRSCKIAPRSTNGITVYDQTVFADHARTPAAPQRNAIFEHSRPGTRTPLLRCFACWPRWRRYKFKIY